MRISDWSSDVCSSDLPALGCAVYGFGLEWLGRRISDNRVSLKSFSWSAAAICAAFTLALAAFMFFVAYSATGASSFLMLLYGLAMLILPLWGVYMRSEEHTSELQSLMRISYAVFCLKK